MKTSPYLQFILTVIAINLTLLTLKQFDIVPKAHAAGPVVAPPTGHATMDVNLVSVNGQSIFGGNVPIVIKDVETFDKLMVEVRGWQTYDKVPVEVKNNYVYTKNY